MSESEKCVIAWQRVVGAERQQQGCPQNRQSPFERQDGLACEAEASAQNDELAAASSASHRELATVVTACPSSFPCLSAAATAAGRWSDHAGEGVPRDGVAGSGCQSRRGTKRGRARNNHEAFSVAHLVKPL
jgi:hypothetical protein